MSQGNFSNKIKQIQYELVEQDTSQGLQKIKADNYNTNQSIRSTNQSQISTSTVTKNSTNSFKNKSSPLKFYVKIRDKYLISYKENECISTIIKFFVWLIIDVGLTYFIQLSVLSQTLKSLLTIFLYGSSLLYLVLFFLDPGTLTDDEQQNFDEDRVYCMTCQLYRNYRSKHCIYCNKCVKSYDHHCSVFGKCIGKRNLLVFYAFLTMTSLTFFMLFIAIIYQLLDPNHLPKI